MTFKKLDPKKMPYFVATVQALMLAYAGVHYFDGLWGWFIGFGVGPAVSFSLAIASSKIGDVAKKRQPLARLLYLFLFVLSPSVVALTVAAPQSVVTIIAWAAAPDLAIALIGVIVGSGMVAKDEQPYSEPPAKKSKPHKPAKVPCEWCGKPLSDSQNAKNAHAPYCTVLQEASKK